MWRCTFTMRQLRLTIVAIETQQWVPFVLLLAYMQPSTTQNRWLLPWKSKRDFHLHICRATKYFVLLLTIQTHSGLHARSMTLLCKVHDSFFSILTKFGILRKVFVKVPNIKFHENQSKRRDGRTSRNDEFIYTKVPKSCVLPHWLS